jgi:hypothetical protein
VREERNGIFPSLPAGESLIVMRVAAFAQDASSPRFRALMDMAVLIITGGIGTSTSTISPSRNPDQSARPADFRKIPIHELKIFKKGYRVPGFSQDR